MSIMNIKAVEIDMKDGTCLRYREYQSEEGVSLAWVRRGDLDVLDIYDAMAESLNIFFYHLTGDIA